MLVSSAVEYTSDGERFVGYLVLEDSLDRPQPGVLICPAGAGLDEETKNSAHRIAQLGYVAFAIDVIGDGRCLDQSAVASAVARLRSDPRMLRQIGRAGLNVLEQHDRVDSSRLAALGYCFGGLVALELAREGCDLKAVVGFHARLTSLLPEEPVRIKGRILICLGADDPVIPPAERLAFEDEMTTAAVDWQMHIYGGAAHAFTSHQPQTRRLPERFQSLSQRPWSGYHQLADERSWKTMRDLLAQLFE